MVIVDERRATGGRLYHLVYRGPDSARRAAFCGFKPAAGWGATGYGVDPMCKRCVAEQAARLAVEG